MNTDVIVVGAGLARLVAAAEVAGAGKRVMILDQELTAQAVIVTSGGIGGNHDLVRNIA
jgi:predicted oxidoreductase